MKNKKTTIGILTLTIAIATVCIALFLREKSYDIRIVIPAGSTETFIYSDEEISPKGSTITLYAGEGMGDGEIVLKPIEAKEENVYKPTYITPGLPVKIDVEKDAWFKLGVSNRQNSSGDDAIVYITISNVDVRIEAKDKLLL